MRIIYGDRGSGKTLELIKISHAERKYIVTTTFDEARRIAKCAKDIGLDIPFPISVSELPIVRGAKIDSVLVDNMEMIIPLLIGCDVDVMTTSIKQDGLLGETQ